jgi:circadian clock protein KaiC
MTKKAILSSGHVSQSRDAADRSVRKRPTGIKGFDEITGGGLPENRMTAIIGSPGAGKTMFALQTLVNRARIGEACIFVAFEEPADEIRANAASFDWADDALDEPRVSFVEARLPLDSVVSGAYDLSGLLAGLSALKEVIGARSIVFDGIDMILAGLHDERLERQELMRLDAWIREAGLSAILTVKSLGLSERDLLRSDFLQYMTDCVVILDSIVTQTSSSRTLRVAKYRGSGFAPNPAPLVISRTGLDVVLIKGARSDYPTFTDRISSGIARLDALLSGGYLRGSSILISGSPGTSKTSLGASFAAAACARGGKALFVSFDESGSQIIANMRSIGLDLGAYVDDGLLLFESLFSSGHSPEGHFVIIRDLLEDHAPDCLVIDPISSLLKADHPFAGVICETLLDHAKSLGITVLCTSLLGQVAGETELSASRVSTIADTWMHVSYLAHDGERNRALTIIKSRGTDHSNQVRELILDRSGINLVDVYVAEGVVLMGTARAQKEAEDQRHLLQDEIALKRRNLDLDRELAALTAKVQAVTEELQWKQREAKFLSDADESRAETHRLAAIRRMDLRRSGDDKALFALDQDDRVVEPS